MYLSLCDFFVGFVKVIVNYKVLVYGLYCRYSLVFYNIGNKKSL